MSKSGPSRLSSTMNATLVGPATEAGKGRGTVVLAHGYGADQSVWEKILPHLARHRRVVAFDWPFSGATAAEDLFDPARYSSYEAFADDLVGLLDELGLQSVVFVGHSMSAMIGCIASVKRPDLFNRLVLVGGSPRYINEEDYEGGFEKSDIEDMLSSMESNYDNWTAQFASLIAGAANPLSVAKYEGCLKRMLPSVALPLARTIFGSDERGVLEQVPVPCTIIQTASDAPVPSAVGFYMQKRMIKAPSTVEIIGSTTGHFPMLTAHLEFLDVLGGVMGFHPY